MSGEHLSTTAEHFTPSRWVELARTVMGGIDCDPASCAEANEVVRAKVWYGVEANGLTREWHGRTFVNSPGSCHDDAGELTTCRVERAPGKKPKRSCTCRLPVAFFSKLSVEIGACRVTEFVWVAFNISQLRTLQVAGGLLEECSVFIPAKRIPFTGSSPTKDNAILYWGPRRWNFNRLCAQLPGVLLGRAA